MVVVGITRTARLGSPCMRVASLSSKLETTLDRDSYVNTCILGSEALICHVFRSSVTVLRYDLQLGAQTFRTVIGAMSCDHIQTGEV